MPKVTVITPFLNAEPYLAEMIESVRGQSERDWELILVDDGSTDGGPRIAAGAAEQDPRILVLPTSGERRGAAAARNLGLGYARSEYVAFLDADDLYEPKALETAVAAIERNPQAGMVYGPSRWWHPGHEERDWTESVVDEANRLHQPPTLLARVILLERGHVPCTCGVLIRRSVIEASGGFEETFRLYEDQTLWVKIFLRYPVFVIDTCMARYRQHPGSVSASAVRSGEYDRLQPHAARTAFLAWVATYVEDQGLNNRDLQRAMRIARAHYDAPPGLQRTLDRLFIVSRHVALEIRSKLRARFRRLLF